MRIAALLCVASILWIESTPFVSSFVTPRLAEHLHQRRSFTTSTTSTCIQASPEPLETEGEWSAFLDSETTGLVYYFNTRTGESRWEPPTSTFPQVYLTPRNRRKAQRVREEYLKAQQQLKQASATAATEQEKVSVAVSQSRSSEPEWFAGLFDEAKQANEKAAAATTTTTSSSGRTVAVVEPKKKVEKEEPNWFGSLFESSPKTTDDKTDEPNWFGNLFDSTSKSKDEPNWFDNLFDSPKKSNEEPNWFASIFDDTTNTQMVDEPKQQPVQQKQQQQPTATVNVEEKPAKVEQPKAEQPAKTEKAPSWVQDRWLGGNAAATAAATPVEEAKKAPGVTEKPVVDDDVVDTTEKPKGKRLFSRIFGRGRKDDDGVPSGDDGARVNGDVVDATLAPPAVTEDKKKKETTPKVKEPVVAKERPVKAARVVEEKVVAPKIEVAPRKTVEIKREEPKIVVKEKEVPIKIDMSAYVLPHPMKMLWGGEDAVFTQGRTFGVFDGVSGANKTDGMALYSKTLANQMRKAVGKDGLTTAQLTEAMAQAVTYADARATGATTALVASIDESGTLNALNVGDSTCIVVREGKIVAQTVERVHFFECPYQLGKDLPDRPKDGSRLSFRLKRGDIIVMASDGVFDNISESEVVKMVSSAPPRSSLMAKRIVDLSRRISLDPRAETPFAKLAKSKGDKDYQSGLGGKVDDVSCIVVRYQ